MPRTTSTIPDDLHQLLVGSVEAGIFENKSDAVRCVLREYFEHNEQDRVAAAVHWYENEEADLATVARMADTSRSEMRIILRDNDIDIDAPADAESELADESDSQARFTSSLSQWDQE